MLIKFYFFLIKQKNYDLKIDALRQINIQSTSVNEFCPSMAVVLNRGAAEPLGAVESSRGAANF